MTKSASRMSYNLCIIITAVIFLKDNIRTSTLKIKLTSSAIAEVLLQYFLLFVLGFFATRGQITGKLFPVGLALVGGLPFPYTLLAAAGGIIGYFFPIGEITVFRYIITTVGIAAVKGLSHGTFKNSSRPFFCAFITGIVTLATGIVTLKGDSFNMVAIIVETIIATQGAYFINRGVAALKKETIGLKSEDLSSVMVSVALLFTGFFGAFAGEVSIGRIAAVVFITAAARFGGITIGTVCGVALSVSALMSLSDSSIIIVFAFGGMLAGIFSMLGKYIMAISFGVAAFVGVTLTGSDNIYLYLAETAVGLIIFLLIPKTVGIKVGKVLAPVPRVDAPTGLKKSLVMRLSFASNALSDVSQTVEQVATELSKINSPDFSNVLKEVENTACKGCTLCTHCWELKHNDTVSAVIDITKSVKSQEKDLLMFSTDEFKGRCLRTNSFSAAVNKYYREYASQIAAENRIEEVRNVVSDQFDGISIMLSDLSEEIDSGEVFDNVAAETVVAALKSIDIISDGCCCKIDKYGRMTVEIRIKNIKGTIINRMQIKRQVSVCLDRDFDAPAVISFSNDALITLSEKSVLKTDIGVSQIACSRHVMCGDAYKYFPDGKGRMIMVLSDGMGTGGRAAVDGAMASGLISRLLMAGFGYDCSLKILNSSMLFKSTDESMATVDVAVIDLFTGKTDLLKAGAAATLVRRSGRTGKAQSNSFPVGILRDITFDKATVRLKVGDIIILLSDGVINNGTEWICAELEGWGEGSAQELSEHISACAKRRRIDNREDDITVMAAIIQKSCE